MGRAARNTEGYVIIYTDKMTNSIVEAVGEVKRRREKQLEYNQKHKITPQTIAKPIRSRLVIDTESDLKFYFTDRKVGLKSLNEITANALTGYDKTKIIRRLKTQMKKEAENLNFEFAAKLRDKVRELEGKGGI